MPYLSDARCELDGIVTLQIASPAYFERRVTMPCTTAEASSGIHAASDTWAREIAPNAGIPIQLLLAEAFRAGAQWSHGRGAGTDGSSDV
jgi:hypothetical protein